MLKTMEITNLISAAVFLSLIHAGLGLGESCNGTAECGGLGAVCGSSNTCECGDGYSSSGSVCLAYVDSACISNTDCIGQPDSAECVSSVCRCKTGYSDSNGDATGGDCVDACSPNPCQNSGTCVRAAGGTYTCNCAPGFSGSSCQTDACSPNPCQNSGTCVRSAGGTYTCNCAPGFSGNNCQTDACSSNPCRNSGTCVRAAGGTYTCICALGFSGDNCQTDACAPNPCQNIGICVGAAGGTYTCTCAAGFSGNYCQTDACSPNPCQNSGTCVRAAGGTYMCNCAYGFSGNNCQTDACSPNPCKNSGTCVRAEGGTYTCTCANGYSGVNCQADTCSPNPCQNSGTCVRALGGTYMCLCADGYSGVNCWTDACSPSPCKNNGTCVRKAGGTYICNCAPGFSENNCQTDACSHGPCQNSGTCVRAAGGTYTCYCAPGFSGNNCQTDACSPSPCQNSGICVRAAGGIYTCNCASGFSGNSCQTDACSPNPCKNSGTCVRAAGGTYTCTCANGYSGVNCQTDVCSPNPCQNSGTCVRALGGTYVCICADGYSGINCWTALAPGPVTSFTVTTAPKGNFRIMLITWKAPNTFQTGGEVKQYAFSFNGTVNKTTYLDAGSDQDTYARTVEVVPEQFYRFVVFAINSFGNNGTALQRDVQAPAGIPPNTVEVETNVNVVTDVFDVGQTRFTLSVVREFFEQETNGVIRTTGLIGCAKDKCSAEEQMTLEKFNTMDTWTVASKIGFTDYRITPANWLVQANVSATSGRRRRAQDTVDYTVGMENCANSPVNFFCNGPLAAGKEYIIVAVACTSGGCLLSKQYGPFRTQDDCKYDKNAPCSAANVIIVAVVMGAVILVLASYAAFITLKNRKLGLAQANEERRKGLNSPVYVNEAFSSPAKSASIDAATESETYTGPSNEYSSLDETKRSEHSTYEMLRAF